MEKTRVWNKGKSLRVMGIDSFKSPYTMEYLAIKKNEIMPFATTWKELKGIVLSEISQTKTNII